MIIFYYVNLFQSNKEAYDRVTSTSDNTHRTTCNYISREVYEDYSFVSTCVKITRYLTHINDESKTKNVKDKCEYLNYFINSNIKSVKTDVDDAFNLFNKIRSVFNEKLNSEIKICMESMKHIKKEELIDLKILMDLFGDFEKFKAINKERETDCSIGKKCVTSYMRSLDKCKDNNNIKFCKILYVFYKYYNEQARYIEHCKDVEKDLPPVNEYFNAGPYEETTLTQEETALPDDEIAFTDEETALPQEVSSASPAVTAVFTVSTLLSTVFLIYKFTPLQSWIRPQIVEKKKLLKNLQEENIKLQENYKINESDTRNNGFNVSYNAVLN